MPGNKVSSTADAVRALIMPYARKLGLSVWDVRYEKEGGNWFLRILIDKPGGITVDDCESMSRAIDGPLDRLDPIKESYCLEVSSPGINRELTREEHFEACAGMPAAAKFIRPMPDGSKLISGILLKYNKGTVTFKTDSGSEISFNRKDTAWIRLAEDDFFEETEE